jgi:thymidylate kinase
MIIFIEGCRNTGKTTLLNEFFKQNTNPNVVYYKFYFAKYIEEFGIVKHDSGPGVHYFSIANVLTILELNQTLLKDKVLIFDRSIFSAYTWSILRKRMDEQTLLSEFRKILDSNLYKDCTLLFLDKDENVNTLEKRTKDYFDQFENYNKEKIIFETLFELFNDKIQNTSKNTNFTKFINNFDEDSIDDFINKLSNLINKQDK